ncbi:MAG: thiolase domain-containing protein [Halobacteria archaeon]
MLRDVAVVGVGQTKFGEEWNDSFRDLFVSAGIRALDDADVSGTDIDAVYGGNMSAGQFIDQEHVSALIADYAGLASVGIPSTRIEAGDASGGLAFRQAVLDVASGASELVVASGVEKMTDLGVTEATDALSACADREWEVFQGGDLTALYAMMARRHMEKYGTTRRQLSEVAAKNHENACENPQAHFSRPLSPETVTESSMVASPLRKFDCSSPSDGASAVVVAPADVAKDMVDDPVYIKACCQSSDSLALHERDSLTSMNSTRRAASEAYEEASITPKDVDLAEVHDSYTIGEIMAIEDLGFVEKGHGGEATESGETSVEGKLAVNPSGGLKACGHPIGATGVRQIVDSVTELRGDGLLDRPKTAVAHNVGGTGGTAVVSVLEVDR